MALHLPIGHLYRPIGLVAIIAACAVLLGHDQATSTPSRLVAFVGALKQAEDPSFEKFKAALARAWPSRSPAPVVRYYRGGDDFNDIRMHGAVLAAADERPAALVVPTADGARAAAKLEHARPLVFATFQDPLQSDIVDTLRRPGRRTTGVSLGDDLDLKRLEFLRDAFPRIRTVALLADPSWLDYWDVARIGSEAERRLGLRVVVYKADTPEALDVLMRTPEAAAFDAWYIPPTYIAYIAEAKIIAALKRLRVPAIHGTDDEVANGALMAYSPDNSFAWNALAELTRRVALGEDAGSIPIQRPYRYTLSVRIEPDTPWARIDPSVVRRADRVHRP